MKIDKVIYKTIGNKEYEVGMILRLSEKEMDRLNRILDDEQGHQVAKKIFTEYFKKVLVAERLSR